MPKISVGIGVSGWVRDKVGVRVGVRARVRVHQIGNTNRNGR
jgi:hypothetical protein